MQSVTFRPQNSSSQKVIDTTISTKSCTWSRELPWYANNGLFEQRKIEDLASNSKIIQEKPLNALDPVER